MRAGTLRHRVTFQQQVTARDTDGAEIVIWSDFATVWAALEQPPGRVQGREGFDNFASQELARADTLVRIRYREGIHHKLRIVFGSRIFDILAVAEVETRRREIHLLCEEKPEA
jgi:SPP1 family predicted phage head-tail adaptor